MGIIGELKRMSFPKKTTVGSLLTFLQEELKKGNVDENTPIYLEPYILSQEEEILKHHQDELGYHIPEDIPAEMLNFTMDVLEYVEPFIFRNKDFENYVAFSCYLGPKENDLFFDEVIKKAIQKEG